MGLLEEIQRMRQTGVQDDQIILKLQEQGNTYRSISEAMSQSRIKQAVEAQEEPLPPIPSEEQALQQDYQEPQTTQYQNEYQEQGMQPSIAPPPQMQQEVAPTQEYFSGYQPQSQDYQQNYDYPQGLSSDTIMEISEQVVSEKLSDVRKKLEKMSMSKTELETKTQLIEERLKRIESIIDSLQTSVLRKVGDYVTNVEDIKKEMVESQKTIARVIGSKHHKEHKKH